MINGTWYGYFLGIDTGGTYTDAVVLDDERGVISTAKAWTTKHDLFKGIQNAVDVALPNPLPDIQFVSLSSTLATNAIVEGKANVSPEFINHFTLPPLVK